MKKVIILSTALVLAFGIAQIGYTFCAGNDYACRSTEALERSSVGTYIDPNVIKQNAACDRAFKKLQFECSVDPNGEECQSARRIYRQMTIMSGC